MYFRKYRLIHEATKERDSPISGQKQWDIGINAVAKRDQNNPYLVVNELIAMELGRLLGVPVVEGVVVAGIPSSNSNDFDRFYWASLSIGEDLPDGDPEEVLLNSPDEAAGAIVFDVWICNGDRHSRNFAYKAKSKNLLLFDHGEAICNRVGPSFLHSNRKSLGLRGCNDLALWIKDLSHFETWCRRVQEISTGAVEHVVRKACEVGLPPTEVVPLIEELVSRQRNLMYLFSEHITPTDFPNLLPIQPELPKTACAVPNEIKITYDLISDDHTNYSI